MTQIRSVLSNIETRQRAHHLRAREGSFAYARRRAGGILCLLVEELCKLATDS